MLPLGYVHSKDSLFIRFEAEWASEITLNGFGILSAYTWQQHLSFAKTYFETHEYWRVAVGSVQYIIFRSYDNWLSHFNIRQMTTDDMLQMLRILEIPPDWIEYQDGHFYSPMNYIEDDRDTDKLTLSDKKMLNTYSESYLEQLKAADHITGDYQLAQALTRIKFLKEARVKSEYDEAIIAELQRLVDTYKED